MGRNFHTLEDRYPEDEGADGISVESGGPETGLHLSETNRDGGIWAVENRTAGS